MAHDDTSRIDSIGQGIDTLIEQLGKLEVSQSNKDDITLGIKN